jgi:hypothetical protein
MSCGPRAGFAELEIPDVALRATQGTIWRDPCAAAYSAGRGHSRNGQPHGRGRDCRAGSGPVRCATRRSVAVDSRYRRRKRRTVLPPLSLHAAPSSAVSRGHQPADSRPPRVTLAALGFASTGAGFFRVSIRRRGDGFIGAGQSPAISAVSPRSSFLPSEKAASSASGRTLHLSMQNPSIRF